MSKRECELYCHKMKWGYAHFYGSPSLVGYCDSGEAEVLRARVSEYKGDNPEYWAWWDNDDNEFHFVWPRKGQVEICSPDGFKESIKIGEGKLCAVKVDIIGKTSDEKNGKI